jgi:chaperonin cofactor prefoldin
MPLVTLFEIELFQKNAQQQITYSKFQCFVVNGFEHLSPTDEKEQSSTDLNVYNSLMKREQVHQKDSMEHFLSSQTLFKYLLSFRILVRTLATTPTLSTAIPFYNSSTFTRLCKDTIGGNCITVLLGLLTNGSPHCKDILEIANEMKVVKQFPIANEDSVIGLLSKFRAELRLNVNSSPLAILPMNPGAAPVLGAARGGSLALSGGLQTANSNSKLNEEQVKELEKKIVQNQLTFVDLQQQHNHLNGQYQQMKTQFKKVLEAKTEAHKKLIESEQIKLETGKALVEVRLSQQQLLKRVQQCEPELEALKKKHDLLFSEFAAMKKNFTKMEQDKHQLELEHEELHVETLKLIAIKKEYEKMRTKITDMKIEYDSLVESLQSQLTTATKQKDVLFQTNKT